MTTLIHSRHASPIGRLHIVSDGEVLIALDYQGYEERMTRLLKRRMPEAVLKSGPVPAAIGKAINAYFGGNLHALDRLKVRLGGTPFQERVWQALRAIPVGETCSYGNLAARLGIPQASRAVGLANGANPIGIVVPCHRVIGANGALTGYAGGLKRKAFLLEHEGALVRAAA